MPAHETPASLPGTPATEHALAAPNAGARAASGGLVRIVLQGVSLLLALVSTAVITRHLGATGFGQYATILALTTLISGVTDFGLANVGVGEWLVRDAPGRRTLLGDLLTARVLVVAVASISALTYTVVAGYDGTVVTGTAIAVSAVAVNACSSVLTVPLMVQLRWVAIGLVEVAVTITQVAIQVPLVLGGSGVLPLAAALVPAAITGAVLTALLVRGDLLRPSASVRGAFTILRQSVAFGAASATSVVYLRTTMLIVPLAVSAEATGHFAVGFRAVESLTIVPLLLTGALFPVLTHAAAHDRERLTGGFDALWRSSATVGAFVASCVIGLAPLAVLAIGGSSNAVSERALVVLCVGLATLFMSAASMWMLLAERAYRDVLRINAVALPLNIALTTVAVLWLGVEWAGLGLVGCEVLIATAANRAVCRRLEVRSLGHGGHGLRVLVVVLLGATAFFGLQDAPLVPRVLAPPLGAAFLLVALRTIPDPLRDMVVGRFRERRPRTRGGS
ncbi:oligosaccharide flippase family protein [Patulibacter minatonensis]|uniref:oligosaccharide flippase family protein n=1 Tax=Patulibacter minatonensis TaxID=298163 RepID=UPI00047CECE9|nr:oligosaccharide flippase family protein [Patulibacter minatonensis]